MLEADIEAILKGHVEAQYSALRVVYPGNDEAGDKPYLALTLVRIGRTDSTLAGHALQSRGRIIGTAVTRVGRGTRDGTTPADAFAAIFPMGLRIAVPGGQVVITKPADIGEGFPQGSDWRTPVVVNYVATAT